MKYSLLIVLSCVFASSCLKIKPKSSDSVIRQVPNAEPSPKTSDHSADLIINHDLQLEENLTLKARRLYFSNKAKILTQGHDLFLEAEEIHFHETHLQTFPDGSTAAALHPGRDGGRITIVAQLAEGHLTIDPRGENGGEGAEGPLPGPELKGATGANGTPGVIGEVRIVSPEGGFGPTQWVTLKTQPSRGANGDPGRRGYSGKAGASGGASAWVRVSIQDSQDLKLVIHKSRSRGGEGGRGGLGGEGGEPGEPGTCFEGYTPKRDDFAKKILNCTRPEPAQKGPRGPDGNSGDRGREGEWIEPCVSPLLDSCVERRL